MDILKVLRELYTEKKRLDAAIATLESRIRAAKAGSNKGRRGRKRMSAAERLKVSKRMTLYWQRRRAQLESPTPPTQARPSSRDQQTSSTSAP